MSLISKQIDELRAYAKDRKGELAKLINDAADTIEELSAKLSEANMERSSQYYNDGWIPCSDRLPELHKEPYYVSNDEELYESDFVLVCFKSGHEIQFSIGDIVYDRTCNSYEWDKVYDYGNQIVDDMAVIAWMPLPGPYKPKEKNDACD